MSTLSTEGRLRELLVATTTIVEGLELRDVLHRIVTVAATLVDARYAALGVIGADGSLEDFIHVGMTDGQVREIGDLPHGHGLLGAVIDTGYPIRLEHLTEDPRSSGFPMNHPQMDSFLGIPIRVRDKVFGNLYLTDRAGGPFSPEDQDIVTALAATAAIAIENARLFDESRRRQRWSAALAEVAAALLSAEPEDVLHIVTDRVASLVDAARVSILVPGPEPESFTVRTARGDHAEHIEGMVVSGVQSSATTAFTQRVPVVIDAFGAAGLGAADGYELIGGLGPTIMVPLVASETAIGVLTLTRRIGSPRFSDADLEMIFEFAQQASLAVELARAQADSRRLELVELRSRIARDLHDHVIQRLFGAGLAIQGIAVQADGMTREELLTQVDAIDEAISDIRTAVFALRTRTGAGARSLRHRIFDVVTELAPNLPESPRITSSGPVDTLVADELADEVVAVVRELLANIVKHAAARRCIINLQAVDGWLTVQVEDDGRGFADSTRRSGIANLTERAVARGGRFELRSAEPSGTIARWSVPLDTAEDGAA